jgi:general L-amino acid transport system substrate-binding protein
MGLSADAFYNVISQVGNYDEIFARNLNPVGLDRAGSANARYNEGGLIYAPPAR